MSDYGEILDAEYEHITPPTTTENSTADTQDFEDMVAKAALDFCRRSTQEDLPIAIFPDGKVWLTEKSMLGIGSLKIREKVKQYTNQNAVMDTKEPSLIQGVITYSLMQDRESIDDNANIDGEGEKLVLQVCKMAHAYRATDVSLILRDKLYVIFKIDKRYQQTKATTYPREEGELLLNAMFQSSNLGGATGGSLDFDSPQSRNFSVTVEHKGQQAQLPLRIEKVPCAGLGKNELSVSIRLGSIGVPPTLEELGTDKPVKEAIERGIAKGEGVFFIVGPTGSGKTTLMLAGLMDFDPSKKLLTIEDPVERLLPNPFHTQISADKSEWAGYIASTLRQDPDGLFVGEIRDNITAEAVMSNARSGHLSAATGHAIDAPAAIERLLEFGIKPSDLAAKTGLSLIVSPRTVPRLCDKCKVPASELPKEKQATLRSAFSEEEIKSLRFACPNTASSCSCNGGTSGLVGIAEFIEVDKAMRPIIGSGSSDELREHLKRRGWKSLVDIGRYHMLKGNVDPFMAEDDDIDVFHQDTKDASSLDCNGYYDEVSS